MNVKFPMTGMTLPLLQTSDSVSEARQKNGYLQRYAIWNSRRHRKLGHASGHCSKENSLLPLTTSSSSMVWLTWLTNLVKIRVKFSPDQKICSTFFTKTMHPTVSGQNNQHNFHLVITQKMHSQNTPMITSGHTTNSS
jgi:hypothetical protein